MDAGAAGVAVMWMVRESRRARQSLAVFAETGQAVVLKPQ